jgi:SAM-dependent methyltransferase
VLADEAGWIRGRIDALELRPPATLVDVGSSSEWFRSLFQPYIEYHVFAPLQRRGVHVVHVDAKTDDGVDLVADVAGVGPLPEQIVGCADLTLCTNLLEHVTDRAAVIRNLHAITKPGGWLIVTVPHRYPYHPDPIDTGFRPSPPELAAELSGLFAVEDASSIDAAPRPLEITDGPTLKVAWRAAKLVWFKLRGKGYRMPTRVLVSGVVARREA